MKELPKHLKYAFLGAEKSKPIIIPKDLIEERELKLIKILIKYVEDLKCSSPFRSDPISGSEPVTGCSFNSFYLIFIYLFIFKCRDPNPRPDLNGGSESEHGLLRPFSFIL